MNCSTKYKLPNLTLLNKYEDLQFSMTAEEQSRKADRIRDIMDAYRIKIEEGIRAHPAPQYRNIKWLWHRGPAPQEFAHWLMILPLLWAQ